MNRRDRIRAKIAAKTIIEPDYICPATGEIKTGCHIWTGGTSGEGRGGGYPRINLDGGTMATHRANWINENGPIPPCKQLDHLCLTRLCIREDHLELVTHRQNMKRRDAAKAKREARP
ncbi:HNH endonuclease [Pseudosulfitobacter pseudonitzschiae]|uniref:HNH nuclease domain-containing protein n=1 Tax=Pseudosulfitobacter pseudonitzschiae TaxID=1402135 RepID=A0A073IWI9_9RHOB|nr:HNH endonuclease signature motif containing protein [Pseudosulfitobacter pseudonitzschiae]KEJ93965.1 hypothetical protein SUH3_11880 [Pseudosulfitobacter pseudonitzschiae]SHG01016.1 HNH endonuclease [Pseudosulfitobacter pseudonitzschiae]